MTNDIIPTINLGPPAPADTATPCPSWCIVQHDVPGAFHAGPNLWPDENFGVRLFQTDAPGTLPGVVVAGQWLTDARAHDLGLSLVRAAEVVRRARVSA